MSKIISIQNSGESFEKSIALFNTATKSDESFYSGNEFYIYYGHNLPKKDPKIDSHGTLGFYEKYFSKYEWCPINDENDLFLKRESFLQTLYKKGCISNRNLNSLCENNTNYIRFIRRIPMEILFPDLINYIKEQTKKVFHNVKFEQLFLEENLMKYFASLPSEKWAYSIYTLNVDGTIGHYYFTNLGNDKYYNRNLFHMFKELARRPILSGNSALLLAEIEDVTKNMKYSIGYRKHSREKRTTRNFALQQLLIRKDSIIEPKNTVFSQYFDSIGHKEDVSMEVMSNMVIAKAYEDFLNEYKIF